MDKEERETLGFAQTHLLFEKSKTKNFWKTACYAVLDGSRVITLVGI
ncbi:MAG: hypothetical protein VB018_00985 [Lachnospiraceae bacterium]|nr:hypothetical protein [Lachnospiraceae bacterium]